MRINDDLTRAVVLQTAGMAWIPSPAAGVERRMLYRVGAEVARATSIVRYAPGSAFPRHSHSGGEEILVLRGTFQDEHGDYPAGSYFRNPPGTSHVPASQEGCEIFVRLWQFRAGDTTPICRPPGAGEPLPPRPGATAARVLFADGAERVSIEDWPAQTELSVENPRGLEVVVIAGSLRIGDITLTQGGWARLPAGQGLTGRSGAEGVSLWIKDAALQHWDVLPMPQ